MVATLIQSLSIIITSLLLLPTGRSAVSDATNRYDADDDGYFDYDISGPYGPRKWKNIDTIESGDIGYFWHSFNLEEGPNNVTVRNKAPSMFVRNPATLVQKVMK